MKRMLISIAALLGPDSVDARRLLAETRVRQDREAEAADDRCLRPDGHPSP